MTFPVFNPNATAPGAAPATPPPRFQPGLAGPLPALPGGAGPFAPTLTQQMLAAQAPGAPQFTQGAGGIGIPFAPPPPPAAPVQGPLQAPVTPGVPQVAPPAPAPLTLTGTPASQLQGGVLGGGVAAGGGLPPKPGVKAPTLPPISGEQPTLSSIAQTQAPGSQLAGNQAGGGIPAGAGGLGQTGNAELDALLSSFDSSFGGGQGGPSATLPTGGIGGGNLKLGDPNVMVNWETGELLMQPFGQHGWSD